MLLKEDTPGHVISVDTKIFDLNNIATADVSNSGITHTKRVRDDRNTTTPNFTPINPTPDPEPNDEHEDSEDDDEVHGDSEDCD